MAFITGQTPQGNCGPVRYMGGGRYVCSSAPEQMHIRKHLVNQWFLFYARIEGDVGETVHIDLKWPAYDPQRRESGTNGSDSFFTAAHECIFVSNDEISWRRIEEVQVDAQNWVLHFSLTLTQPVCFVSVNFYYTRKMYAQLRQALSASPFITETTIGKSWDGQDIPLFIATDRTIPADQKKIIYLQGGQHCSELSGPHTLDAMLRYLASGLDGAADLLRRYEFHIVPVLSMAGWANGAQEHYGVKNPNRDWEEFELPEPRAVDAYLRSLRDKPVMLLDLHNGWTDYINDGAAITVMKDMPEAILAEQMRFAEMLISQCDNLAPGRIWHNLSTPSIFKGYAQKHYGLVFTMEFSRYSVYDRSEGRRVPLSHARYHRFGRQLAHVIDDFLSSGDTIFLR